MTIIPFHTKARPPVSAQEAFVLARRDMLRAYRDWLQTRPAMEDVLAEIEATTTALGQLHHLEVLYGR